eukprot:Seg2432.7 transcript_id=Seg2432.7/GoldUCD/mRNA.D3Y31 product=Metaxin-1 protein_id=Seg2432.7/GoldUCD/D3Y31
MELFCWEGDWGLPSIDINCLYVAAHAKFSEAQLQIKTSRIPIINKRVSNFPILKQEDGNYIHGAADITEFLIKNDYQPDFGLTPEQYANVVALKALVLDKIYPYVMYCLWMDSKNFTEFSRPLYAKKCIFPLNFIVPGRIYNDALDYINGTKLHADKTSDVIGEELHLEAVDCINLLSSQLGDKAFFFGDRPTSFDALLFAYLAPLVKANLASTKLQNHVKACENLVKFVSRILTKFFSEEKVEKSKGTTGASSTSSTDGAEKDYEWVLPVAVGSLVMFMYATNIGLLTKIGR